jgi:hypothetical protein
MTKFQFIGFSGYTLFYKLKFSDNRNAFRRMRSEFAEGKGSIQILVGKQK